MFNGPRDMVRIFEGHEGLTEGIYDSLEKMCREKLMR